MEYVSKSGDSEYIKNNIKGETYLFEKDKIYKVISVSENAIKIESDVDKWDGVGKDVQTFLFESNISKYETEYFPIFSNYFQYKKS
jgi:hypothetical protein